MEQDEEEGEVVILSFSLCFSSVENLALLGGAVVFANFLM